MANHERFTMRKHRNELLFYSRLWHKGIQVCISYCIIKCGTFLYWTMCLFSSYILCIIIQKISETKCCSSLQKRFETCFHAHIAFKKLRLIIPNNKIKFSYIMKVFFQPTFRAKHYILSRNWSIRINMRFRLPEMSVIHPGCSWIP